jgi:hypothetical protein
LPSACQGADLNAPTAELDAFPHDADILRVGTAVPSARRKDDAVHLEALRTKDRRSIHRNGELAGTKSEGLDETSKIAFIRKSARVPKRNTVRLKPNLVRLLGVSKGLEPMQAVQIVKTLRVFLCRPGTWKVEVPAVGPRKDDVPTYALKPDHLDHFRTLITGLSGHRQPTIVAEGTHGEAGIMNNGRQPPARLRTIASGLDEPKSSLGHDTNCVREAIAFLSAKRYAPSKKLAGEPLNTTGDSRPRLGFLGDLEIESVIIPLERPARAENEGDAAHGQPDLAWTEPRHTQAARSGNVP